MSTRQQCREDTNQLLLMGKCLKIQTSSSGVHHGRMVLMVDAGEQRKTTPTAVQAQRGLGPFQLL
jgi:hypothetical protein